MEVTGDCFSYSINLTFKLELMFCKILKFTNFQIVSRVKKIQLSL